MTGSHTFLSDLINATEVSAQGTPGTLVFQDDQIRVVVTGLDEGQKLAERIAALSAIVQVLSGQVRLKVGSDTSEFKPGDWAHVPAGLPYSVEAQEPSVMLQTLLPAPISALFPSRRGRRQAD